MNKRSEQIQKLRIENDRFYSCTRKVRFNTFETAFAKAYYFSQLFNQRLNFYKCDYCKGFHLTKRKVNA